ncbi:MAG: phage portal protein [Clostridia bacterium]|nr:phage portal protein [Clostridia bacterium]
MKISDRFKIAFSQKNFDNYLKAWMRGDDSTLPEGPVDADTAMTYTAVFACVRVLSETLASLPIKLYQRQPNGDKRDLPSETLYDMMHNKPNDEMTPFAFKECMMTNLNLGGNAYAQKLYNAAGEIVQLYPIIPDKVRMERNKEAPYNLIYHVKQNDGTDKPLTRNEILHIPGLSIDGINGLTPIGYAAKAVKLGLQYENFGYKFFKNGARPSGYMSVPGELSPTSYDRLKNDFDKNFSGEQNVGKTPIFEGGTEYKQLTINQADAQYLESRKFQTEEIARIYRVPLHLIQNLDKATFSNIEQQSLEFVIYTMLPWAKRWEEALNTQILTDKQRKAGWFFEFSMDALLRGDITSRYAAYAIGRQWGWLSVNDILRMENKNTIGDAGKAYLTPMNMVSMTPESAKSIALEIYNLLNKGDSKHE